MQGKHRDMVQSIRFYCNMSPPATTQFEKLSLHRLPLPTIISSNVVPPVWPLVRAYLVLQAIHSGPSALLLTWCFVSNRWQSALAFKSWPYSFASTANPCTNYHITPGSFPGFTEFQVPAGEQSILLKTKGRYKAYGDSLLGLKPVCCAVLQKLETRVLHTCEHFHTNVWCQYSKLSSGAGTLTLQKHNIYLNS